ncbi:MAG: hypothetical protein MRY63_11430 [Neomegalonema sp.]|nr:hypothetical protein [Neomegalonema sp.]
MKTSVARRPLSRTASGRPQPLASAFALALASTALAGGLPQGALAQQAQPSPAVSERALDASFASAIAKAEEGNFAESYVILKVLGDRGHARSQWNLGILHRLGLGTQKDAGEAFLWFKRAARSLPEAQRSLGILYLKGEGVERDDEAAAYWFTQAADRGDAISQYNLGLLFEFGVGTRRDAQIAGLWFAKAAAQGHEKAAARLAQMREQGLISVASLAPEAVSAQPASSDEARASAPATEPDSAEQNTAEKDTAEHAETAALAQDPAQTEADAENQLAAQADIEGIGPEQMRIPGQRPPGRAPEQIALVPNQRIGVAPPVARAMRARPDLVGEQAAALAAAEQAKADVLAAADDPGEGEPNTPNGARDTALILEAIEKGKQDLASAPDAATEAATTVVPAQAPAGAEVDTALAAAKAAIAPAEQAASDTTAAALAEGVEPAQAAIKAATEVAGENVPQKASEAVSQAPEQQAAAEQAPTEPDADHQETGSTPANAQPSAAPSPDLDRPISALLREAKALDEQGAHEQSAPIWMALAERGDAQGMFQLGRAYSRGRGVPLDRAKAYVLWRKAAAAGEDRAATALANIIARMNEDELGRARAALGE